MKARSTVDKIVIYACIFSICVYTLSAIVRLCEIISAFWGP